MRLTRLLTDKEIELANDYSTREETKRKKGDYTFLGDAKPFDAINKLGQLEDIEDDLGIDLVLYCNVMKNQVIYIKGKEPEWADNGTKKDIVKYCVVRFTAEELVVRFNEDCSKHVIAKPLKSYGKIWALTKEELL